MRAGCVCRFFVRIKEETIIQEGAAVRTPAERFQDGLKVSAAGHRPMFHRRKGGRNGDSDSVSERTGDGKS